MKTVLVYTVQSGDNLSQIAATISAVAGVSWPQIAEANPELIPNVLQIGQVIKVPAVSGDRVLFYTICAGDTLSGIAGALSQCCGLTYQQIIQDNLGLTPNDIQIGQRLNIPAQDPATTTQVNSEAKLIIAANMGYWDWTYGSGKAPANATMSIAFSGWTDVATALQQSNKIKDNMVGEKFICLGGGNEDGAFDPAALQAVTNAINEGTFKDWDGIAFDVEEGASGMAALFSDSFAAAKNQGLQVLVTVSHSAPYGINDAPALMQSFFVDDNIDYLSPQLYTTGSETSNDYDTSHGVCWSEYGQCKAKVLPSLVQDSYFADAQTFFAGHGVTLAGYVRWSQVS